jgi:hypothetical protein
VLPGNELLSWSFVLMQQGPGRSQPIGADRVLMVARFGVHEVGLPIVPLRSIRAAWHRARDKWAARR